MSDGKSVRMLQVLWMDFTDLETGETVTLDVADAPVAGNGETLIVEWDADGFVRLPRVEDGGGQ